MTGATHVAPVASSGREPHDTHPPLFPHPPTSETQVCGARSSKNFLHPTADHSPSACFYPLARHHRMPKYTNPSRCGLDRDIVQGPQKREEGLGVIRCEHAADHERVEGGSLNFDRHCAG